MAYASRHQANALGLTDDEIKSIEQTRQRLYQLSNSIQSFKADIAKSNPLPPQSSLQAQYHILLRNLQSLLDVLTENAVPFAHTSIHPAVNFPGRTQENVLLTLLRKKREPEVEEHVERGLEKTREVRASGAAPGEGDGVQRLEAVWDEIREWTQGRVQKYVLEQAGDVYTRKEREDGIEKVRTGLKRPLEEPEESEEEEDEEGEGEGEEQPDGDIVMGDGQGQPRQQPQQPQQQLPEPEVFFWFAARGEFTLPPNIELEKDAAKRTRLAVAGGMPRM
ncbi:hypothetical protein SODALDRAFT_12500 [Sodiomyces alkalinus F11]|uniref:Mediator of RNA polymerase II transcription subunit 8 n=1 Tax=Sodiomyces alkalinus (strain CBS 110278 / VKM F-3762 / F11) TaxID=1314773 RepID=A0A3N2Q6I5_SODAK|nr:hypothetical protein SODALDRAFT_12500 [Sodiomyces alkalinus F11]ROT42317.1 hypothetical protein SODALDRAFT_12500 [Sodiomyces alkalinus F11]